MAHIKIAARAPFEGAPRVTNPSCFGAAPKKPFLLRVNATGARPMRFSASGLPAGLTLSGNIIAGRVEKSGKYKIVLAAENALGRSEKEVTLEIRNGAALLTPLMGFTTWNAFAFEGLTQAGTEESAAQMLALGLCEYGYTYVNIDSGWQGAYGGEFDAVMPNEKFPDMKGFCERMHEKGLKCGIYSTPMLHAFGCSMKRDPLPPGCTQGAPDDRFADERGGIGLIRKEKNNALQWAAWGFDYLKYDWVSTDMVNTARMREALDANGRDMVFSLVTGVALKDAQRASELANLYRSNADTAPCWDSIHKNGFGNGDWNPYIGPGHWLDLDMLTTTPRDGKQLSRNELLTHISCWMMRPSPILLDCDPRNLDDYLRDLLCNDEIISVNQDALGKPAATIFKDSIWEIQLKPLADGNCAVAFFNLSDDRFAVAHDIPLAHWVGRGFKVRDLWARQDLTDVGDDFIVGVAPHSAKLYKIFVR